MAKKRFLVEIDEDTYSVLQTPDKMLSLGTRLDGAFFGNPHLRNNPLILETAYGITVTPADHVWLVFDGLNIAAACATPELANKMREGLIPVVVQVVRAPLITEDDNAQ